MAKAGQAAPPQNAEDSRQRALAARTATQEYITSVYGANAAEVMKTLPKTEKQQVVCELMMAGISMNQAADAVGVNRGLVSQWFSREPVEMQKIMRAALTKDALLEVPKTWGTLKSARDSENQETARKAALDCMRAAGLANDPGAGAGAAISIHAQNLQFNNLSVADLDRKIVEIAGKLGTDAMKLAEAEVKGDGKPSLPTEPGTPA
jgi:transposase-like protein